MLEERVLVIFFKISLLHTKNQMLHLDQPLQLVLPLLILGQRQQQLLGKLERKNRCQLKIINPQGKVERKFKEAVGLSKITGGLLRRIFRSLSMKLFHIWKTYRHCVDFSFFFFLPKATESPFTSCQSSCTMLLFRQRARQAAAAIHAVASARTKAAQAEAAHAQKLVVLIC